MRIIKIMYYMLLSLLLGLISYGNLFAQKDSSARSHSQTAGAGSFVLHTFKLQNPSAIHLDGKLDEAAWQQAPIATGFTQRVPDDGLPATEKTEARVLYTDKALYVGIKAYDTAMDSVAATLFRKDGTAYSDWVYVGIDSYDDNRTSFSFAVNPKGVRKDILTFGDTNEDIRWDAVWEAKTTVQNDEWTVEMRIPLSQLRFSTKANEHSWGINFQRRIARKQEISFWAPTPQHTSGFVSQYGTLEGIKDLKSPTRLEITPYTSARLSRAPGSTQNPFYKPNDWAASAGADLKYGLSSDFTLTATVNPDFGQVEADPAVINLSAFETFFPEQRPFFLEGTDIFQFGRTETFNTFGNPLVFYSRRIGRRPQGNPSQAGFNTQSTDIPEQTTIAGAAKISGKTKSGFSLGVLNAFTTREKAGYLTLNNNRGTLSVEPPSNYFVGRIKQDFDGGKTIIGAYGSATNRFINAGYLKNDLHNSAYIAGADFERSWNDREWILSGVISASSVSGSKEAILKTQKSPARYYNRVDAGYLSVDPDKTSLSGYAGELSFARFGGEHWHGSVTYSVVSPGYEVNDIGFENRADYHAISYYLTYVENKPAFLRRYELWAFGGQAWNFGGNRINNYYRAGTFVQFKNLWSFNINSGFNGKQYMDRISRGGPLLKRPTDWNMNFNINSPDTKKVSFNIGSFLRKDTSLEYDLNFWVGMQIRPATFIQFSISPELGKQKDIDQYITTVKDELADHTYGHRYVFSNTEQTTLSASLRLDWTFTPNISLQTYLRPFITSVNFYDYKELSRPRSYDFTTYGKDKGTISQSGNEYTVDPDGNGPARSFQFESSDFNFRSIQTNAVFRWEYLPGSVLYLVWQQERNGSVNTNDFRFSRDFNGLFDQKPTNVFLIKFSYWLGS